MPETHDLSIALLLLLASSCSRITVEPALITRMPEPDSDKPPFLPILGYVLGFMALLALLAFLVARLLRVF